MTDWRKTEEGIDWRDGGEIELRYADGRVVRAQLEVEEIFTGEDEIPSPRAFPLGASVYDETAQISFYDAEFWRPAA